VHISKKVQKERILCQQPFLHLRRSVEGGKKPSEQQRPLLGEWEMSHPPQADLSHLQVMVVADIHATADFPIAKIVASLHTAIEASASN